LTSCAEEEFTLFSRVVIILEFICNDDGRAYLLVTTDVERALIRGATDNNGWQEVEDENASTTVDVLLIATAIDRAVAVDIKEVFIMVACGSEINSSKQWRPRPRTWRLYLAKRVEFSVNMQRGSCSRSLWVIISRKKDVVRLSTSTWKYAMNLPMY
jgi:hypothetical protein